MTKIELLLEAIQKEFSTFTVGSLEKHQSILLFFSTVYELNYRCIIIIDSLAKKDPLPLRIVKVGRIEFVIHNNQIQSLEKLFSQIGDVQVFTNESDKEPSYFRFI